MHATIRRYAGVTASAEEVARLGRALGRLLGRAPGFVACVVLDLGSGEVAAVTIFDDAASQADADGLIARWDAAGLARWPVDPPRLATGEVVAQAGL